MKSDKLCIGAWGDDCWDNECSRHEGSTGVVGVDEDTSVDSLVWNCVELAHAVGVFEVTSHADETGVVGGRVTETTCSQHEAILGH